MIFGLKNEIFNFLGGTRDKWDINSIEWKYGINLCLTVREIFPK